MATTLRNLLRRGLTSVLKPSSYPTIAERGILYIATGVSFIDEAVLSAESVKAAWPSIPLALITDSPPAKHCFDHIITVPAEQSSRDKPRYMALSPFERTLFLDADTYCCAEFSEIFDLLNRHELVAAYEDCRFTERLDLTSGAVSFVKAPNVPDALPELNTGVIAFRRTPAVLALLQQWLVEYDRGLATELLDYHDQPSFRSVVYRSNLRVGILPSEYNFRLSCPGFARTQIKLVHGRWTYEAIADTRGETMQKVAQALNSSNGPRVFVPFLGMIHGHGPHAHAPAEPERRLTLVAT